MAGDLLNTARIDAKSYITAGGFEENIVLTSPSPSPVILETTGFATKHHISFSEGEVVNSKNAHICIDENSLAEQDYPVRNEDGEVHLKNHRVSVKDSSGELKEYVIIEWFPNETLGLIVCILGDYASTN